MSTCVGGRRSVAAQTVVTFVVVMCGLWFGLGVVRAWWCLVRGVGVFVGMEGCGGTWREVVFGGGCVFVGKVVFVGLGKVVFEGGVVFCRESCLCRMGKVVFVGTLSL